MGWIVQDGPLRGETPAQWAKRTYSTDHETRRNTVLAAATVRGVIYAAVRVVEKDTGLTYVIAFVIPFFSDRTGFGYRFMSERVGPCEADCPDRIMRLLSPLADIPDPSCADVWRDRVADCRNRRARAQAMAAELRPGIQLRTATVVRFRHGAEADLFEVAQTPPRRRGRYFVAVGHGFLTRLRPEHIATAEQVTPS